MDSFSSTIFPATTWFALSHFRKHRARKRIPTHLVAGVLAVVWVLPVTGIQVKPECRTVGETGKEAGPVASLSHVHGNVLQHPASS